jgi:cytochrome c biogenesis protein CcdA
MTTVLASGKAKKALKSGLAFSTSIFISYFLMGIGLYKALSISGYTDLVFKIIGVLAIILGLFNLKDAVWYGKGFIMEVPLSWRPKLKELIKSITSPIVAFFIGFAVSLILLPCTSGPYIVILGLLAHSETMVKAIAYLLLYNVIFVSPMLAITILVYRGLKPEKLEKVRQKNLRLLHLIAGLILLALGVYMFL